MKVIGLTGGVATGKSTVAAMFAELGAAIISADEIAREIVRPGQPALAEIVAAFGQEMLHPDGTLNRDRLGRVVFGSPEARKCLEAIAHPYILDRQSAQIEHLRAQPGSESLVAIVEAPLLFEANARGQVDRVVVVASEQKTQVARLTQRVHLSHEEALSRISAQWPLSEKIKRADWVIGTDCSLEDTRGQVREVWEQIGKDCYGAP